jgi:hypothetical protein
MTNKSYRPGDRPVDLLVTAAIEHASVPVSATGAAIRTEPWANDAVSPENTTLNLSAYVGVRRPVRRGVQIAVATVSGRLGKQPCITVPRGGSDRQQ